MGMRGRGDRQEKGEPVVKSIGIIDRKTQKNSVSATKFVDLLCQKTDHGGAGKEVGETLRTKVTVGAFFRGNRIRKSGTSGPPVH